MNTAKLDANRIHQLDGLRGLLALYVVVYHLSASFVGAGRGLSDLALILGQAWYSVDVFFVMSGFVMAHVYGDAFTRGITKNDLIRFFKARVARLHMVHLFAMAMMAFGIVWAFWGTEHMTSMDGRYSWQSMFMSMFMLHGPWIDHRTWNYPAWSISAEWHAYVLFPLLVAPLSRLRAASSALLMIGCLAVPLAVYLWGVGADTYPTNGPIVLARVLPLFCAGMLLKFNATASWATLTSVTGLVFAATLVLLFYSNVPAFAVLLIPAVVACVLSHRWVSDFFCRPSLLWLGKVSYSLYMTHTLIEMYFVNVLQRASIRYYGIDLGIGSWSAVLVLLCSVMLSLVLAWATWRWIEEPGRRWVLATGRRS